MKLQEVDVYKTFNDIRSCFESASTECKECIVKTAIEFNSPQLARLQQGWTLIRFFNERNSTVHTMVSFNREGLPHRLFLLCIGISPRSSADRATVS